MTDFTEELKRHKEMCDKGHYTVALVIAMSMIARFQNAIFSNYQATKGDPEAHPERDKTITIDLNGEPTNFSEEINAILEKFNKEQADG